MQRADSKVWCRYGCGSEATVNTESNVTTTTENQNTQTTEPVNITVWHCADATIADTLQKQVDALAPEIVVTFERKYVGCLKISG